MVFMHKNNLTGQIPSEIGKLARLESLWLSDNDLEGDIPNQVLLAEQLGQLTSLYANGNPRLRIEQSP